MQSLTIFRNDPRPPILPRQGDPRPPITPTDDRTPPDFS